MQSKPMLVGLVVGGGGVTTVQVQSATGHLKPSTSLDMLMAASTFSSFMCAGSGSCAACHTPHATRHTPHVTRHTPHATRHTSHATRHLHQNAINGIVIIQLLHSLHHSLQNVNQNAVLNGAAHLFARIHGERHVC
jgi:hypothetical protein